MEIICANAKAVAGAAATLVVLLFKPYLPQLADPAFQPALELVIGGIIVGLAVWFTPNAGSGEKKDKPTDA